MTKSSPQAMSSVWDHIMAHPVKEIFWENSIALWIGFVKELILGKLTKVCVLSITV